MRVVRPDDTGKRPREVSTEGLPQRGEVIAGKFQVEDVLGAGGMGVVVAARHLVLRQRVAVKFLLPQAARLPEASARFVREARAAVAIQSEHVARVLDVGTLDSGAPYMVMEFLAGTDLGKLLRQRAPLPVADAVDYLLQAGEAIAEAHALGIVHRDLKPGNLFVTARAEGSPLVKVLDFGLSKMADDGAQEASLTATGFVIGSPQYMSPEQVRSLKHVDWRTDIWALGVILYEMLTGRRPFDGPSLTAVSASIVLDTPASMCALRPELPPALEAAVLGCMEKDRERRTRSVAELAQAIAPFAPQRSWPSVERIVKLSAGTVPAPDAPAAAEEATVTLLMPTRHEVAMPESAPVTAPPSLSLQTAPPSVPLIAQPPMPPPSAPLPMAPAEPATPQVAPTTTSTWQQAPPVATRPPLAKVAVATAVVVASAMLGAAFLLRGSSDPAPASAPPAASETAVATAEAPKPPAPPITASATATAEAPPTPAAPEASASAPAPTAKPATPRSESKPTPPKPPKRPASVLDRPD